MRFVNNAISTSKTGMGPKCLAVRNVRVHIQYEHGMGGTTKREIRRAHCKTCGAFISQESRDLRQKDSWEQI